MLKSKRIEVRITPDDKRKIIENAEISKMSMSEYLINCGLGKNIIIVNGLDEYITELRRIGNNINQLTKLSHQGIIRCVELEETKKELYKLWQSLNLLTIKEH